MNHEVALAFLHRDRNWLIQLRDDVDGILYPGHWGLFGGHLQPGETPAQAVHRELIEEINLVVDKPLDYWFSHNKGIYVAHIFRGPLVVSLDQLHQREGQDICLASIQQLSTRAIWSSRLQEYRPIAPGLEFLMKYLRS